MITAILVYLAIGAVVVSIFFYQETQKSGQITLGDVVLGIPIAIVIWPAVAVIFIDRACGRLYGIIIYRRKK